MSHDSLCYKILISKCVPVVPPPPNHRISVPFHSFEKCCLRMSFQNLKNHAKMCNQHADQPVRLLALLPKVETKSSFG